MDDNMIIPVTKSWSDQDLQDAIAKGKLTSNTIVWGFATNYTLNPTLFSIFEDFSKAIEYVGNIAKAANQNRRNSERLLPRFANWLIDLDIRLEVKNER
jgi:hypothetical protein